MDTREYKTLIQCYPGLVSCMQQSPNDIEVQLRPYRILAPADLRFLSNPSHDDDKKARRIVDAILTQVQSNTRSYHMFIKALKAAGDWTEATVRNLEQAYASIRTENPHKYHELIFEPAHLEISQRVPSQLQLELKSIIGINDVRNSETADSIYVLVTGETGSGKSTLVSGLLGVRVDCAQESYRGIGKYEVQKDGITLTVWDSPGLQDGTGNQGEYLRQIKQQCNKRDLTIYCISMSKTRFVLTADNPDVVAMKKLNDTFGNYFWENCVFALTYANTVEAFDTDWEWITQQEQVWRFQAKVAQRTEQVLEILRREIRVPEEIIQKIKIVPAGHFRKPHLPGNRFWLSNFWLQCIDTIISVDVRSALMKINMNRIKRTEREIYNKDFELPAHMQPIMVADSMADSSRWSKRRLVGVAILGGIVLVLLYVNPVLTLLLIILCAVLFLFFYNN